MVPLADNIEFAQSIQTPEEDEEALPPVPVMLMAPAPDITLDWYSQIPRKEPVPVLLLASPLILIVPLPLVKMLKLRAPIAKSELPVPAAPDDANEALISMLPPPALIVAAAPPPRFKSMAISSPLVKGELVTLYAMLAPLVETVIPLLCLMLVPLIETPAPVVAVLVTLAPNVTWVPVNDTAPVAEIPVAVTTPTVSALLSTYVRLLTPEAARVVTSLLALSSVTLPPVRRKLVAFTKPLAPSVTLPLLCKVMVLVPVAVSPALRVISPPIKVMGPEMLVAPDKVMACVLPVLPSVKPLSVLPKVRPVGSKVLIKLTALGVILTVPEEAKVKPVLAEVASMRSATKLMLLLLESTCPAF